MSVSLGELIDEGVLEWTGNLDWSKCAYDYDQFRRVNTLIEMKYWGRDLGVLPIKRWIQLFMYRIRVEMDKLRPLYAAHVDELNLMQTSRDYNKSRNVISDFPATVIAPSTSDYASSASDSEGENYSEGDPIDQLVKYRDRWQSLDEMLVDSISDLFSGLYSVNINGL
jgi:hypothetical protein